MKKVTVSLIGILLFSQPELHVTPFWEQSPKKAQRILNKMSLDEKIGQLFMLGIYSYDNTPDKEVVEKLITKHHVGGFMFMYGSVKKQQELASHYQSLSKIPLMFSQDNELGRVKRLKELVKFPDSMTLGATQGDDAYKAGAEIGKRCNSLGIHLNFAPVVDVNNNPLNPIIHDRSFGENKQKVADNGIAVMKGMHDQKVLACAKHFPGHGDVAIDSHLDLPTLNKSLEELEEVELYPFRKMIESGVQVIMTAHINFPQLDKDPRVPATLSPMAIRHLLLEKLGFKGLVITDALNMNGITKHFPLPEASLKALLAGNDILLFGKATPHPEEMYEYTTKSIKLIHKAVKDGLLSEKELDEHVIKILMAKEWLGLFDSTKTQTRFTTQDINSYQVKSLIRKVHEKATTLVKNDNHLLPLSTLESYPTAYVQVGGNEGTAFQRKLRDYCDAKEFYLSPDSTKEEVAELVDILQGQEIVIVSLHGMSRKSKNNFSISKQTLDFLHAIKEKRVILCVFGSPYSLKNFGSECAIIMAYEDVPEAQAAAARIIGGDLDPVGKLPVSASEMFQEGCGINF